MRYLMMLCDVETTQLKPGEPGFAERMGQYAAFGKIAEQAGAYRDAGKLVPTGAAKTVRIIDGKTVITDGPFAETKEQVGGFYILECDSPEQALELAAKIPTAKNGCVEVRAILM